MADVKVNIELDSELVEQVKQWAKVNKVTRQHLAYQTLIRAGLGEPPKGYNLDNYFENKAGEYEGPDGSKIVFSKSEVGQDEVWQVQVTDRSGWLAYLTERGRSIGSDAELSFGTWR